MAKEVKQKEEAKAVEAPSVVGETATTAPEKKDLPTERVLEGIQYIKGILAVRASFAGRIVAARKVLSVLPRNGRVIIEDGKTLVSYVQLDDMLPLVDKALEDTGTMYMTSYEGDNMRIELFDIKTGESLFESETPLPPYKELADFGRTSTYVRRYLIATVLGISIATDSDAVSGALPAEAPRVAVPSVEYKTAPVQETVTIAVPNGIGKAEPEQPSLFKEEVKQAPIIKKEVPPFPERSVSPEEEKHNTTVSAVAAAPKIEIPTYSNEQRDASALIYAKAAKSIQDSPNEEVLNTFAEKIKDHPKLIESDKQRLMDLITDKKFNLQ